jgi:hypothetical protein
MAKICALPKGITPPKPDYRNFDVKIERKKEEEFLNQLRTWLNENIQERDPLMGTIVRTHVADGYAQYMVCGIKPFAMIHLPLGDAWRGSAPWERGFRVTDARQQAQRARLFS